MGGDVTVLNCLYKRELLVYGATDRSFKWRQKRHGNSEP